MHIPEFLHAPQALPDHRFREFWLGASKRIIRHRLSNTIQLVAHTLPQKEFLLLDIKQQDISTRSFFLAYHYSTFYVLQDGPVPQQEDIAAALLGPLFNIVDYTQILPGNNEFQIHCEKAGFTPFFTVIIIQE